MTKRTKGVHILQKRKLNEVRAIRFVLNWSQAKLAKEMGVSQPLISYLEKQTVLPSKEILEKLKALKERFQISDEDFQL